MFESQLHASELQRASHGEEHASGLALVRVAGAELPNLRFDKCEPCVSSTRSEENNDMLIFIAFHKATEIRFANL